MVLQRAATILLFWGILLLLQLRKTIQLWIGVSHDKVGFRDTPVFYVGLTTHVGG